MTLRSFVQDSGGVRGHQEISACGACLKAKGGLIKKGERNMNIKNKAHRMRRIIITTRIGKKKIIKIDLLNGERLRGHQEHRK